MIPNNTALFIFGHHGPPPQAQLLCIQIVQYGRRCETQTCCRPEMGTGILTATEYFQTSLTKSTGWSENHLFSPLHCAILIMLERLIEIIQETMSV